MEELDEKAKNGYKFKVTGSLIRVMSYRWEVSVNIAMFQNLTQH